MDDTGGRYNPNILRFGGGKTAAAQAVCLEELVEQEQQGAAGEQQK